MGIDNYDPILVARNVVLLVRKNTRVLLKMADTREYFNEHVHMAKTAVYNVLHINLLSCIVSSETFEKFLQNFQGPVKYIIL